MAEALYDAMTGTRDASSAGVDLGNSVMGNDLSLPPLVIDVMKEAGLDLSGRRRKLLAPDMVARADKVVAITDYPLPDYLKNSPKLLYWNDIPDAVRTDINFHRKVRDLVRERVSAFIGKHE